MAKQLSDGTRIDTFDNVGSMTTTSQGIHVRVGSQQVAHSGSRSSKNAITMQNLSSLNQTGVSQQSTGQKQNSSSSKRKTSKKLTQNAQMMYNSQTVSHGMGNVQPAISNGAQADQIQYMLQNKREKFN